MDSNAGETRRNHGKHTVHETRETIDEPGVQGEEYERHETVHPRSESTSHQSSEGNTMKAIGGTVLLLLALAILIGGGWYLWSNRTPSVATTVPAATAATIPVPATTPAPLVVTAPVLNPQVAALIAELQRTEQFLMDTLAGPNPSPVLINELNARKSELQFKIHALQQPVAIPAPQIFIENPNQMNRAILETGPNQVVSYSLKSEGAYKAEVYTQANARQEQLTALGAQLKAEREVTAAEFGLLREKVDQTLRIQQETSRRQEAELRRQQEAEEIPVSRDKSTQSQSQEMTVVIAGYQPAAPAATVYYVPPVAHYPLQRRPVFGCR